MPRYPKFESIVTKYFQNHSPDNRKQLTAITSEIVFSKRPDGWHVEYYDYSKDKPFLGSMLFWDRSTGFYTRLPIEWVPNEHVDPELIQQYQQSNDLFNFQSLPYYGYIGWYNDIIKEYDSPESTSDSLIYALAYAYSSKRSNYLNHNYAFSDTSVIFKFDTPYKMNDEQLKVFNEAKIKTYYYFDLLVKVNPFFETVVGNSNDKRSNEYVFTYLELCQYYDYEYAKQELSATIYSPLAESIGKNLLSECSKKGILFTYGDANTFLSLYVQEKYNYRKDVSVINLSLLSTPSYFNWVSQSVNMSLEQKTIEETPVVFNERSNDLSLSFDEIINYINDSSNAKQENSYLLYSMNFTSCYHIQGNDTISFFSPRVMYGNNMAMLDIIKSNPNREIHFSSAQMNNTFHGIDKYLYFQGTTQKLSPHFIGEVELTEIRNDLFSNIYEYPDVTAISPLEERFLLNYLVSYYRSADEIFRLEIDHHGIEFLDQGMVLYEKYELPHDFILCFYAAEYYKHGEQEKGIRLAKRIISFNQNKPIDMQDHRITEFFQYFEKENNISLFD